MYPRISDNTAVQQAYERMRKQGQTHNLAEMLALRQCPRLRTNATLLAAVNSTNMYPLQEDNMHTRRIIGQANKLGVHPKNYQPQFADFPGDPKAYLPNDDPSGHIKKLEQRQKDKCSKLIDSTG